MDRRKRWSSCYYPCEQKGERREEGREGGRDGGREGGMEGGREGGAYLDVRVHDELHQAQNFTGEMEGVSKTTLLPFLGGQGLGGLQVEVVVQVQV